MDLIEIFKAFILGIIEGITEWLPISSTGHMLLVDEFMTLHLSQDFKNMFFVVVQLGAILAVVVLFFHKLNPFSPQKTRLQRLDTIELWIKVAIACIPTVVVGLPFNDLLEEKFSTVPIIAAMLIIYGILFIVIENWNQHRSPTVTELSTLSYKTAFCIGLFQVLSIIPGTSRSGATIIGAILLGTSRYVAAEFTFFLGIPTMFGASFLKIIKFGFHFSGLEVAVLLTGMITAFIVSVIVIKFLMNYIKKHDFKIFGWYRIVLGIIVLGYFFLLKKS